MEDRFIKPTDDQLIKIAILFNNGIIEPYRLADMVGMAMYIVDRLYENGDVTIPAKTENATE